MVYWLVIAWHDDSAVLTWRLLDCWVEDEKRVYISEISWYQTALRCHAWRASPSGGRAFAESLCHTNKQQSHTVALQVVHGIQLVGCISNLCI